jgi:hypothetical protein
MKTSKAFSVLLILLFTFNFLFAQQATKETVYFDYGKYELTPSAKALLDKTFQKLSPAGILQITLTGHTDADGSDGYNLELSRNRTKAVMDHFVSKGISNERISIKNFGEGMPVAQNQNEDGKQQNRRVEITFEKKQAVVSDLLSKLGKEAQTFKVTADEDIEIKGEEGTMISIPVNSLVDENGHEVKGEVNIALKEFYKKSDFITSNLHSMSDKAMLESAGMIHIEATTTAGKKLKLKKGAAMDIEFAAGKKIEGMELFRGEEKDGMVNWVPEAQPNRIKSVSLQPEYKTVRKRVTEKRWMGLVNVSEVQSRVVEVRYNALDKMILSSANLGWINCDRFMKNGNITDLWVDMDTEFKPTVRLVFKNINSVMPAYFNANDKMFFPNVPVGQTATLVAFSMVNEEPYFVTKEIKISANQKVNLEMMKTTVEALQLELQKLN